MDETRNTLNLRHVHFQEYIKIKKEKEDNDTCDIHKSVPDSGIDIMRLQTFFLDVPEDVKCLLGSEKEFGHDELKECVDKALNPDNHPINFRPDWVSSMIKEQVKRIKRRAAKNQPIN